MAIVRAVPRVGKSDKVGHSLRLLFGSVIVFVNTLPIPEDSGFPFRMRDIGPDNEPIPVPATYEFLYVGLWCSSFTGGSHSFDTTTTLTLAGNWTF